jgi:hypothetical protein
MTSKHLYISVLLVLIVGRRRTPINNASPSPDIDSLEMKIKAEPIDSSTFFNSTPKNKSKKIATIPIEISSNEEVIATPTLKAKSTSANRKTTSKTKPYVPIRSV